MKKLLLLMITCVNTAFSQDVSLIEKELLRLIQEERTKAGLDEVVHLEILDRTAEIQATYLSTLNNIYHVSHSHPNKSLETVEQRYLSLRKDDIHTYMGENITVFGYQPSKGDLLTALHAHTNFMGSKGHAIRVMSNPTCSFSEDKPSYNYGHCIIYDKETEWIIVVQVFQVRFDVCRYNP
jgi:uncharacterized protein YkwD